MTENIFLFVPNLIGTCLSKIQVITILILFVYRIRKDNSCFDIILLYANWLCDCCMVLHDKRSFGRIWWTCGKAFQSEYQIRCNVGSAHWQMWYYVPFGYIITFLSKIYVLVPNFYDHWYSMPLVVFAYHYFTR